MIFSFLKRKYEPRPIFAPLGTDMHCHLVPKVDDGSKCFEESIECLNMLAAVGFNKVYITPHFQSPRFNNDEDDIRRRYEELKKEAQKAGVTIQMAGVGGEYRIDPGFPPRLQNPRFLKVGDYVLIEFSLHQQMMGCDELMFDMQMKGYELILAHPERYPYLNLFGSRMEQLRNQGVHLQVNVLSLGGFYGEEAKRRAYTMIENGWVDFLGTDTHNTMYAQALADISHDRKVEKIIEKYTFMNKEL